MSLEKQIAIEEALKVAFDENELKSRISAEDFELYNSTKEEMSFQKGDDIFEDGEFPKGIYVARINGTFVARLVKE